MNKTAFVWAFLAGGISGAVIALLYAPQSGRESREMLRENSNKIKETAIDAMKKVRESAESAVKDTKTQMDVFARETETFIQKLKDARHNGGTSRAEVEKSPS